MKKKINKISNRKEYTVTEKNYTNLRVIKKKSKK